MRRVALDDGLGAIHGADGFDGQHSFGRAIGDDTPAAHE
jgi:hypothetical protein